MPGIILRINSYSLENFNVLRNNIGENDFNEVNNVTLVMKISILYDV